MIKIQLKKNQRLSEFKNEKYDFSENGLPTGIIDKKYTGLGATYCEIHCNRNSIIVSPTRDLAWSKYVDSKKADELCEKNYFYLGGGHGEIPIKKIEDFLKKSGYKKIFVVANSFPKLINIVGKSIYDDFALVVDEIDSLQTDSSYRSSLEFVIDYFWDFKSKTVVTATYIDFSDKRFIPTKDFPLFNVELEDYEKPDLNFYKVSDPIMGLINLIHEINLKDKDHKFFIALNSITYINEVIKTLLTKDNYTVNDFGVLCSENSRKSIYPNVKKTEIKDGKLEKRINLATSSYFVGIDIEEPVHLIVCNADKKSFSVIFPEKILQIIGRSRVKAHSLNLVSFSKLTNPFIRSSFPHVKRDDFIKRTVPIRQTLEALEEYYSKSDNPSDKELMQKKLLTSTHGDEVSFLRLNHKGKLVISDFTVDYLAYNSMRVREYEKGVHFLKDYLKNYFEIKEEKIYISEFIKLEKLTSAEKVESFLQNYVKEIFKTSEFYRDPNWNVILLDEAIVNKNRPATASLILQSLYFTHIYGSDFVNEKIREYNKKALQISAFARKLKLLKLVESEFFKNTIIGKFEVDKPYTFEELKSLFFDQFAEKKRAKKPHISDYISLDFFSNSKTTKTTLESVFELKDGPRITKKRIKTYEILSFESPEFKPQFNIEDPKKKSQLELEKTLGVDVKSTLLSVPDEILDNMIK